MSYDVCLEADLGGAEPVALGLLDRNYTYNVSGMLSTALGHPFMDLHGMPAGEAGTRLKRAIVAMKADPGTYRAMNPTNGWGDYEGALLFITDIYEACAKAPSARVAIY